MRISDCRVVAKGDLGLRLFDEEAPAYLDLRRRHRQLILGLVQLLAALLERVAQDWGVRLGGGQGVMTDESSVHLGWGRDQSGSGPQQIGKWRSVAATHFRRPGPCGGTPAVNEGGGGGGLHD